MELVSSQHNFSWKIKKIRMNHERYLAKGIMLVAQETKNTNMLNRGLVNENLLMIRFVQDL